MNVTSAARKLITARRCARDSEAEMDGVATQTGNTLWLIKCFDHHIYRSVVEGEQVQMKQLEHTVEARSSAHLFPFPFLALDRLRSTE